MRKEFEMTETQLNTLMDACKPVPYMVFGGSVPSSPQENAYRAWTSLGNELGFDAMSVEPSSKGKRFFTAEATVPASPLPLPAKGEPNKYHIDTEDHGYLVGWTAVFDTYDGAPDSTGRDSIVGRGTTEADAIVDLITEAGALESEVSA